MATEEKQATSGSLPEDEDGVVAQDPAGLIGADEHPPIPPEGGTRSRRRLLASPVWGGIPMSVLSDHGLEATWLGSDYPEPCRLYAYSRGYGMRGCKHPGMDISMPAGTELRAIEGGNVYAIRNPGISGSIEVRVRTANRHEHLYNHMSRSVVAEGTNVTKGQLLGYSGVANSPHLHFELRVPNAATAQGTAIVDPEDLLTGGGAPSSGFSTGDRIRVDTDSLNLRSRPTTSSDILESLAAGTELCVVGGPQEADGHQWFQARTSAGRVGWVASQYCRLVESGACGFEAGDRITVSEDGLRLRKEPGTSSQVIGRLTAGTELCVTGASRVVGDHTWYPVDTGAGASGWVAGTYCGLAAANGCGDVQPDPDPDRGGSAVFEPTGPGFAGGNLDDAEGLINGTAVTRRVPANFLAAIIAHESTGDWERDGSRFSDVRPESGKLLPYIGVFENTAISRVGMTSAQFRALLGDQAGQINLLGTVLRSQYDQIKRRDSSYNWLNVASYHFSGNPVPQGWDDELGTSDQTYYNNIRTWWGRLEPGYDPDSAPAQRLGAAAGRQAAATQRAAATEPTPDDAHEDPAFDRVLDDAYQQAQARGAFEEPARSGQRTTYVDESDKLYVGREFTLEEFARWFAVQKLGSLPFNAIGYHHTWKPKASTWAGIDTLTGIYNYYDGLGWSPWGKGPHLWVYSGEGDYRPGTARIYVGTHPAHDGYGIAYSVQTIRNGRWCHVEHIWNGDEADFSDALMEVSGKLLGILCARHPHADREIPLTFIRDGGVNNPSEPLGIMYHRDENPSWTPGAWPKSCPGLKVSHDRLDPVLLRHAGAEPCTATPPPAWDGADKTVDGVTYHADRREVESAVDGLRCRQLADTSSCQVRESLRQGERFEALYWVDGEEVEGEKRWWVSVDGFQVWMGGTVEKTGG